MTLAAGLTSLRNLVIPSNDCDPTRMTPAQRRTEAAVLLALGLHRLRAREVDVSAVRRASPVGRGLGFPAEPRVHANPAHRSPQA
jgi:hypothetical protein